MDVLSLPLLAAAGFGVFLFIKHELKRRREIDELTSLLNSTLKDYDRELTDHKGSELELALLKSKLETLQSTSLTPDNSIPKHMHVEKVLELAQEVTDLRGELNDVQRKFEESRGKQISERTRLGQTTENFAAFFSEFPYDRKEVKALFQPIDLIYFGDDEVVFIDVKTGASTLSTKQRRIRDNIRNGKVRFEVHRLDEAGYKIIKD